MTRITLTTTALILSTTAAFAGPVDVPPPPPPVVVAADDPFEGFYIGLEYGHSQTSGAEIEDGDPPESFNIDNDTVFGAFAGYNVQEGALVYGGEIRYLHIDLVDATTGFTMDSVLDIRARLGYALNDAAMVYGALGYSTGDATDVTSFDMSGFNYGVGAEYNLTESIFLGVDYTGRQLEGERPGFSYEADVNTLTLRAGLRF